MLELLRHEEGKHQRGHSRAKEDRAEHRLQLQQLCRVQGKHGGNAERATTIREIRWGGEEQTEQLRRGRQGGKVGAMDNKRDKVGGEEQTGQLCRARQGVGRWELWTIREIRWGGEEQAGQLCRARQGVGRW